jgi:hypothetical protein
MKTAKTGGHAQAAGAVSALFFRARQFGMVLNKAKCLESRPQRFTFAAVNNEAFHQKK